MDKKVAERKLKQLHTLINDLIEAAERKVAVLNFDEKDIVAFQKYWDRHRLTDAELQELDKKIKEL